MGAPGVGWKGHNFKKITGLDIDNNLTVVDAVNCPKQFRCSLNLFPSP
jgi:hypothetical protein